MTERGQLLALLQSYATEWRIEGNVLPLKTDNQTDNQKIKKPCKSMIYKAL